MELSKISAKGQVTIPAEIRKKLNLKEGDKVLFLEEEGKVFITNAAMVAFQQMQQTMDGAAGKLGVASEEEMSALVKDLRKELWEKTHARHD